VYASHQLGELPNVPVGEASPRKMAFENVKVDMGRLIFPWLGPFLSGRHR
jgi:hypothetical protein